MAFPTTPAAGDKYNAANGVTYQYTNKGVWKVSSSDIGIATASWTTATRPSSPKVGQAGLNTTLGYVEVWNGTIWSKVGTSSFGRDILAIGG